MVPGGTKFSRAVSKELNSIFKGWYNIKSKALKNLKVRSGKEFQTLHNYIFSNFSFYVDLELVVFFYFKSNCCWRYHFQGSLILTRRTDI